MKALLVIPLQAYERLVSASSPAHPTYLLLKNGVLDRRGNASDCVRILTSPTSARFILDFAAQTDSEVRASIRQVATPADEIMLNLANLLNQPPLTFRKWRNRKIKIPANQPTWLNEVVVPASRLHDQIYSARNRVQSRETA